MKKIVVTGGASGIGKAIAEKFLEQGHEVVIFDRDQRSLDTLTHENLIKIHGDLSRKEDLDRLVLQVQYLDCLVNNAAINLGGLLDCSYEDYLLVQKVNHAAPFYLTKRFMNKFCEGASIINLASTRKDQSQPNTESYSASKGAIAALTHAMSMTLNVRVNSISPGWIATEEVSEEDNLQHPTRRVGNKKDIANLAYFLFSEEASFITGQDFVVDGGMSRQMIYHNDNGWTYKK